jgi:hypothetical protein
MKHKGCLFAFVVFLACIGGILATIQHIQRRLHPVYYGKTLVEWADEAIWAEDHETRQKAVEVLREGRNREGEEARLRVYKELAIATKDGKSKEQLPDELLPYLLEAFKEEGQCAGMVAGGLEKCPASQTVPLLIELLMVEREPIKEGYLIRTLSRFGPKAQVAIPLIRQSLRDPNMELRRTALGALEQIDPK